MKRLFIVAAFMAISTAVAVSYEPPTSIWGQNNSLPCTTSGPTATVGYTIATKFTVNTSGVINELTFYKNSLDTVTSRNMILWSTGGTNLAECQTANEPFGFNQWLGCKIHPFNVSSGTTLLVSYDAPAGSTVYSNVHTNPCDELAPQTWMTCVAAVYANTISTFPTTTDTKNDYVDVVLTH